MKNSPVPPETTKPVGRPPIVKEKRERKPGPNAAAVIALRETGLSYGSIAKESEVSVTAVFQALSYWRPDLLGYLPANKQFKRVK